ncbi:hypothetical protein N9V88_04085 [bacterium]|nr:hypothetical protein [bacterium]
MKIRNPKNRQGITLLFVVSMIVLFLLMGTTFVVISNDYFKAARKRGQAKLHTVDHEAVIRRAFYDVVRGPSLLNHFRIYGISPIPAAPCRKLYCVNSKSKFHRLISF